MQNGTAVAYLSPQLRESRTGSLHQSQQQVKAVRVLIICWFPTVTMNETQSRGGEEGAVKVASGYYRRRTGVRAWELALRALVFGLTLAAAIVLGTDKQTTTVTVQVYPNQPPVNVSTTAKWHYLSAFLYVAFNTIHHRSIRIQISIACRYQTSKAAEFFINSYIALQVLRGGKCCCLCLRSPVASPPLPRQPRRQDRCRGPHHHHRHNHRSSALLGLRRCCSSGAPGPRGQFPPEVEQGVQRLRRFLRPGDRGGRPFLGRVARVRTPGLFRSHGPSKEAQLGAVLGLTGRHDLSSLFRAFWLCKSKRPRPWLYLWCLLFRFVIVQKESRVVVSLAVSVPFEIYWNWSKKCLWILCIYLALAFSLHKTCIHLVTPMKSSYEDFQPLTKPFSKRTDWASRTSGILHEILYFHYTTPDV